jgi:hypothetical protein
MDEPANQPGPGRSTAEAAFDVIKKQIDQRNEQAHKIAQKLREVRGKEQVAQRRKRDLL